MQIENFTFGQISIDGAGYEHDVVIDRGEVRERKTKPSKNFKADFGHTPLSVKEKIPWECERLVIGTGAEGNLPVMKVVKKEAKRRNVKIEALRTEEAIKVLNQNCENTNAILHVTCLPASQWIGGTGTRTNSVRVIMSPHHQQRPTMAFQGA